MGFKSIIFDLDGTLVDSSNGVLKSLVSAFSSTKASLKLPISSSLIGPPLRETLCLICSEPDETTIEQLIISFKSHYDTLGWKNTIPYPGVSEMLQMLVEAKIPLHIATNKRKRPTLQIIEALGWSGFFDQVLSPDSCRPPLTSKAAILRQVLTETNLSATDCFYIGDRFDDEKAAKEIGMPFALAAWGFEEDNAVFHPHTIKLKRPNAHELMNFFRDRQ
jgi:phosphoglycolate phosphatase